MDLPIGSVFFFELDNSGVESEHLPRVVSFPLLDRCLAFLGGGERAVEHVGKVLGKGSRSFRDDGAR